MTNKSFFTLLLVLALATTTASAASYTIVATSDTSAPGGNGTFGGMLPPSINDAGQVAFRARLKNTTGTNIDNEGIFRGDGVVLTQIARAGQPAPDGNGTLTFDICYPAINTNGQVAFWTELVGTSGGDSDKEGIFIGNGTNLVQVARTGQPIAPGNTNTFYQFIAISGGAPQLSLNEKGQLTFWAAHSDPLLDPFFTPDQGVYRWNGTQLVQVALRGQSAGGGNFFESFQEDTGVINNSSQIAFPARLSNGDDALYLCSSNGVLTRIGQWNVSQIAFNDGGRVAFSSYDNFTFLNGIWRIDGTNVVEIALSGDTSPDGNGVFGSPWFNEFSSVALNSTGQVAFLASLTETTAGYSDDHGYYRGDDTNLLQIAREGQFAPGGNGKFAIDLNDNYFAWPVMNNAGQVAFVSKLRNTTGGNNDNDGIFFYDQNSGLQQVVRKGQAFLGSTLTSFTTVTSGGTFAHYPPNPGLTGLNNRGQVAFNFILNDGREGIAIWSSSNSSSSLVLRATPNQNSNSIVLSWPTNFAGTTIETNGNAVLSGGWQTFPASPSTTGSNFTVTVPTSSPRLYFRLKK